MTTVTLGKGATYTLDTKELDRILRDMPAKKDQIVRKTAFEIEASAKKLAPVDTGALKSSIFPKTSKTNRYTQSLSDAQNKNSEVSSVPEDEFGDVKEGEAIVGSSVDYAFWVEMGRKKGKVAARPFLGTACEMAKEKFNQLLKDLVTK